MKPPLYSLFKIQNSKFKILSFSMSDVIRLLPDSVANQIAAGEVIQRPASVIKELVENALDAGAENIHVLITDAGRTNIQVIDDGKGMSETDARLSFERHATSKIREAADLFALRTMGFRGEALASIAAVAQVELKTRLATEQLGTHLVIAGSKVESQDVITCPIGSNFSVKNLFFNIPVRRKFLKSNSTELSNILTEFERIVLVHPEVAFTLHHNDGEMFNLPVSSLRQRILAIFGKKLNQQLLSVDVDTTLVKISGFIGKPETARKKGAHQYFFVNGRYMRHPYFHKAIVDAYEHLIPVGEQVSYFLYFEVEPANIDVNIHPTKTEIKFENEPSIWQILSAAVKEALGKFNAVPSIDFDTEGMPEIPAFDSDRPIEPPRVHVNTDFNPFRTSGNDYSRKNKVDWEDLYNGFEKSGKTSQISLRPDAVDAFSSFEDDPNIAIPSRATYTPASTGETDMHRPAKSLYSGSGESVIERGALHLQYKGRFILTSVKSGLMLIDQHRAHTRVLFDKYIEQIKQKQGVSQGVLFPEILQLPASEVAVLQSIMDDLTSIGFELNDLGGGSYAINGIPSGIEGLDPVTLIRNMVTNAVEKGSDVKDEIQTMLAITLARAAAIVYGQVLSLEEMCSLVDNLFACSTPNYTPDGRIVLTTIKDDEIDKLFK